MCLLIGTVSKVSIVAHGPLVTLICNSLSLEQNFPRQGIVISYFYTIL